MKEETTIPEKLLSPKGAFGAYEQSQNDIRVTKTDKRTARIARACQLCYNLVFSFQLETQGSYHSYGCSD